MTPRRRRLPAERSAGRGRRRPPGGRRRVRSGSGATSGSRGIVRRDHTPPMGPPGHPGSPAARDPAGAGGACAGRVRGPWRGGSRGRSSAAGRGTEHHVAGRGADDHDHPPGLGHGRRRNGDVRVDVGDRDGDAGPEAGPRGRLLGQAPGPLPDRSDEAGHLLVDELAGAEPRSATPSVRGLPSTVRGCAVTRSVIVPANVHIGYPLRTCKRSTSPRSRERIAPALQGDNQGGRRDVRRFRPDRLAGDQPAA